MALKFAILTALSERESSGFELARRFDRAFGYFWSATHQQIYRELDRLGTAGFVAEVPQLERRERGQPKRFSITPAGTAALRMWVHHVDEPTQPREALMVRLRAAATLGDLEMIRGAVAHHLEVHERTYSTYLQIEERDFRATSTNADVLRHLVLKGGLETERAWADWCREVLETVDAMRIRPAGKTKGSRD